ncbi:MAG TPA: proton-conducting transporter membrane subunit [Ktedonobacterales bacterium]
MSLSLFFGVLTLTPAVMALAILGLGFSQRARAPLVLGLVALGTLVPAAGLLLLTPDLSSGVALHVALWPGQGVLHSWFAPLLRMDRFGLFMALGLAFLVTPLLLWVGWQSTQPTALATEPAEALEADEADEAPLDSTEETSDAEEEVDEADEAEFEEEAAAPAMATPGILRREQWASLALVLGIESAGLLLCFAENILWLGAMWLIVVALTWVLGELGSEGTMLDRRGLGVMLAGPICWIAAMLLVAVPLVAPRFYDLMGRGSVPALKVLLLGLAIALASGAYPFLVWVRRRAAFTTPAGLGAVLLVVLPVAAVVGARTYSAVQDTASLWPQLGSVTPPITIGIFISLLGAITIGISGLLALGRTDGRSLLALLGSAQAGWVLFALGTGQPATMIGLVVLLTTMVLGLGAMLVSLVAGGMVTTDLEPTGAGPRPFGAPARGIQLFAWCVGAVSLVGAPLFAGFISRQMITASALGATKLTVPLVGLAWAGDALLALALLRATAPAFIGKPATEAAEATEADATGATSTASADLDVTEAEETEELEAEETEAAPARTARAVPSFLANLTFGEALGAIFAVLALLIGFAPQWLLAVGGVAAASDLVQPDAAANSIVLGRFGYQIGASQWAPTIAWIVLAALAVIFGLLRLGMARVWQPAQTAGYVPALATPEEVEAASGEPPLAEPTEVWKDLAPAFRSSWALPASDWLLSGVEDDTETSALVEAGDEDEDEDEAEDLEAERETEPASEEEAGTAGAAIPQGKRAPARTPSDEDAGGQA